MSDDLYFIPILAQAFRSADRLRAFRNAFDTILAMGRETRYHDGLKNFRAFVEVGESHLLGRSLEVARTKMDAQGVRLPSGDVDALEDPDLLVRALVEVALDDPEWFRRLRAIYARLDEPVPQDTAVELVVKQGSRVMARVEVKRYPSRFAVAGVRPGPVTLVLSTGRVLWEDELSEADLLWSRAFPGQALEMAADTGLSERRIARHITLLDGEVVIRVFPGRELGRLEVSVIGPRKETEGA